MIMLRVLMLYMLMLRANSYLPLLTGSRLSSAGCGGVGPAAAAAVVGPVAAVVVVVVAVVVAVVVVVVVVVVDWFGQEGGLEVRRGSGSSQGSPRPSAAGEHKRSACR